MPHGPGLQGHVVLGHHPSTPRGLGRLGPKAGKSERGEIQVRKCEEGKDKGKPVLRFQWWGKHQGLSQQDWSQIGQVTTPQIKEAEGAG